MPVFRQKIHRRDVLFVALLALLAAALAFAPSGIENRVAPNAVPVRARILEVDNSGVSQFGIVKAGQQEATVRIESRRFKGRELEGGNMLLGEMELDKMFVPGDRARARNAVSPRSGLPHSSGAAAPRAMPRRPASAAGGWYVRDPRLPGAAS